MVTWGSNSEGQLGNGTQYNSYDYFVPAQVGSSFDWKTVEACFDHSVALKNDNTLWIWGDNSYGELGNPNVPTDLSIPTQFETAADWNKISGGSSKFTIILKEDGTLWSFGRNVEGQLGNHDIQNTSVPGMISCLDLNIPAADDDLFAVYPNPAKEFLFVQNQKHVEIKSITIIDIYGKTILMAVQTEKIDTSRLATGIYILKIQTNNKTKKIKFVKS
ncbi:T9SS type A sorting domain-containing protein [Flavobacterium sp. 3HN19-14]|uniref:T9SS type A sorting domain-containing protein n=1 Tax=Flavobacterium sp. 3HN19-14 TaxID=3448133 RepID=UPI003EDF61CD